MPRWPHKHRAHLVYPCTPVRHLVVQPSRQPTLRRAKPTLSDNDKSDKLGRPCAMPIFEPSDACKQHIKSNTERRKSTQTQHTRKQTDKHSEWQGWQRAPGAHSSMVHRHDGKPTAHDEHSLYIYIYNIYIIYTYILYMIILYTLYTNIHIYRNIYIVMRGGHRAGIRETSLECGRLYEWRKYPHTVL